MKRIIFVCHGSICRSPAAEFIFKNELKRRGLESEFEVTSLALSNEEIGNDIYPPMKRELDRVGIPYERHYARKITMDDYIHADLIFYMDDSNKRIISYLLNDRDNKIKPIYFYTDDVYEIEDPWYTDNFSKVVSQIKRCVNDILDNIS